MRIRCLPLILFLLAIIYSAGCLSFGTQTTDIVFNNEVVGNVTIVPDSNGSYGVTITVFGLTFSKEGLTQNEAAAIAENIGENPAHVFELLGGDVLSGMPDTENLFENFLPENAGEPTDIDEFIDSILNMPITNAGTATIGDSFSFENAASAAENAVSGLENIVSKIFGQ